MRELQIKNTLTFHLTLTEWLRKKNADKDWCGCGKKGRPGTVYLLLKTPHISITEHRETEKSGWH